MVFMTQEELQQVREECDRASYEHVMWLLGRDPVAEQRELQEIADGAFKTEKTCKQLNKD
jgi:hypothetical protein